GAGSSCPPRPSRSLVLTPDHRDEPVPVVLTHLRRLEVPDQIVTIGPVDLDAPDDRVEHDRFVQLDRFERVGHGPQVAGRERQRGHWSSPPTGNTRTPASIRELVSKQESLLDIARKYPAPSTSATTAHRPVTGCGPSTVNSQTSPGSAAS